MKRRLLIGIMAISVIFGILLSSLLIFIFEGVQIQDLTSSLDEKMLKMSRELSLGTLKTAQIKEIAEYSDFTIAMFNASNVLTYDSVGASGYLEKSGERTEVMEARESGYALVRRNNATVGRPMLYLAVAQPDGTILRLGYPLDVLSATQNRFVWYFSITALIALALYFVFAQWLSRRITNEQYETVFGMEQIIKGVQGVQVIERKHAGAISITFNRLSHYFDDQNTKWNKNSETFSILTSTMQSGILVVDTAFHITLLNDPARQYLGTNGDVVDKPLSHVVKNASDVEDILRAGMQQASVHTGESSSRTSDGRAQRPLRFYVSALRDKDKKILGAVALIEDVAELRRLERARTDFAANVSHELRTPLTTIQGFIETLQDGAVDDPHKARKFLDIISVEAKRLNTLIGDILSLSKYESGEGIHPMDPVRLDLALREVTEFLSMNASMREIKLTLSQNLPEVVVWGAKDRVKQLLINLIENGIKYNKPGGEVIVSAYQLHDNAYVSISDTGIGISQEHIGRIFERFYRVDKGRSRSMGGTGLGLAIVKHIAQSMNATIEVHSVPGKGTEFLLCFNMTRPKPLSEEAYDNLDE